MLKLALAAVIATAAAGSGNAQEVGRRSIVVEPAAGQPRIAINPNQNATAPTSGAGLQQLVVSPGGPAGNAAGASQQIVVAPGGQAGAGAPVTAQLVVPPGNGAGNGAGGTPQQIVVAPGAGQAPVVQPIVVAPGGGRPADGRPLGGAQEPGNGPGAPVQQIVLNPGQAPTGNPGGRPVADAGGFELPPFDQVPQGGDLGAPAAPSLGQFPAQSVPPALAEPPAAPIAPAAPAEQFAATDRLEPWRIQFRLAQQGFRDVQFIDQNDQYYFVIAAAANQASSYAIAVDAYKGDIVEIKAAPYNAYGAQPFGYTYGGQPGYAPGAGYGYGQSQNNYNAYGAYNPIGYENCPPAYRAY